MEFNLYAIKDELSAYTMPIAMENDELAKRHFRNQLVGNEIMKNSKKDFSIYRIGKYDIETGKLVAEEPTLLERGSNEI